MRCRRCRRAETRSAVPISPHREAPASSPSEQAVLILRSARRARLEGRGLRDAHLRFAESMRLPLLVAAPRPSRRELRSLLRMRGLGLRCVPRKLPSKTQRSDFNLEAPQAVLILRSAAGASRRTRLRDAELAFRRKHAVAAIGGGPSSFETRASLAPQDEEPWVALRPA
jgi:hypothetical protein